MKQSDPLQLVAPGTLARPGPLGRLVRLLVGIACSYALFHLYVARAALMTTPLSALPDFTLMALVGLYVENHVVGGDYPVMSL